MQSNKLIPVLLVLAVLGIAFFVGYCSRESKNPEKISEPRNSEKERTTTIATNTAESAKYKALAEKQAAQIEALSGKLAAETGKRKQAEQKARESAAEYAKNRTLDNCDKALTDCQEENETKAYSLAVSERMIAGYESSDSLHRGEIERQGEAIVKLDNGWKKANEELAKEKGKRFGLGLSAGCGATKHGFSPQVSVSVNYNLWKF